MHAGIRSRHPRLASLWLVTGVTAVFATIVLVTAGCSSDSNPIPVPDTPAIAVPSSTGSSTETPSAAQQNNSSRPVAATTPLLKSAPMHVRIPAIGVDSDLMALGLAADGTMQVPPIGFPAGWFTGAPTPGELGPAIIAGHVDWGGNPGVFYRLRDIKPGNEVDVARADGRTAVFRVTHVAQVPKDKFPTGEVYGDIDHSGLRVITCGGSFDRQARSYLDNIVAFADLVAVRTP